MSKKERNYHKKCQRESLMNCRRSIRKEIACEIMKKDEQFYNGTVKRIPTETAEKNHKGIAEWILKRTCDGNSKDVAETFTINFPTCHNFSFI